MLELRLWLGVNTEGSWLGGVLFLPSVMVITVLTLRKLTLFILGYFRICISLIKHTKTIFSNFAAYYNPLSN